MAAGVVGILRQIKPKGKRLSILLGNGTRFARTLDEKEGKNRHTTFDQPQEKPLYTQIRKRMIRQ